MLALSGGREIDVFGEWDGEHLWPLSAFHENRFTKFGMIWSLRTMRLVWRSVALSRVLAEAARVNNSRHNVTGAWARYLFKDHYSLLQGHFQMSLWTEITNTALIGCEREIALAQRGGGQDRWPARATRSERPRRRAVRRGGAGVALRSRGTLPLKDTRPLPEACEPDDAPRCGERAAIHLAMMLRGEYRELLPEWMAKTAAAGRRVSEELLPPLLELGRTPSCAKRFCPCWARGALAGRAESGLSYAVGGFDETLWETGNSEQRRAVLAELRKRDTTRARDCWRQPGRRNRRKTAPTFLPRLRTA